MTRGLIGWSLVGLAAFTACYARWVGRVIDRPADLLLALFVLACGALLARGARPRPWQVAVALAWPFVLFVAWHAPELWTWFVLRFLA